MSQGALILHLRHLPGWGLFSPGNSQPWPRSWSPSHHVDPLEDHQEEHSSANLVGVIAWICDICDLPPAPSESHKIRRCRAGPDAEDQPSSSCQLLVGDVSADILVDLDHHISTASLGMHSKKASKLWMHSKKVSTLLFYPGVCSRCYCRFEGEEIV